MYRSILRSSRGARRPLKAIDIYGAGIYDKDRIDPVEPGASLTLDSALLGAFPEGYRHLAYVQTKGGFQVRRDLPSLRGPAVERVYAMGAAWLARRPIDVE